MNATIFLHFSVRCSLALKQLHSIFEGTHLQEEELKKRSSEAGFLRGDKILILGLCRFGETEFRYLGFVQVLGDKIEIPWICAGLGRQNSDTLDLCRFAETKFRDLCKFETSPKNKTKRELILAEQITLGLTQL